MERLVGGALSASHLVVLVSGKEEMEEKREKYGLTKKWAVKYWLIYWSRSIFSKISTENHRFFGDFLYFVIAIGTDIFQNIIAVGTDTGSYRLTLTGICQYFEPWRNKWLDPNGNYGDVNTIRFATYLLTYRRFPDNCPVGSKACMF